MHGDHVANSKPCHIDVILVSYVYQELEIYNCVRRVADCA